MFKKLLLLDFNVIGIITSFINNNFHFLYFLQEKNIQPFYQPIDYSNVDWEYLSDNLNEITFYDENQSDILFQFNEKFNWNKITTHKIKEQNFLIKYSDYINFDIISEKMKFDETLDYLFFTNFKEKLNWTKISRWANMAEDFIDIFFNELDWEILCRTQGLTPYLLHKYFSKLILEEIRYNFYIDNRLKTEIIIRLENINNSDNNENINNSNQNHDNENDNEDENINNLL